MVNCLYRTSGSQCSHKNVYTTNQVVNDRICSVCKFRTEKLVDENMVRNSLPQVSGIPQITVSGPEIEGPGIVQLGVNFGGAVLRQVEAGLKGEERYVSQEEYKRRMEICGGCEFQKNGRCLHKKCGCFLARKNKLSTEHCPLDPPKW